MQSFQAKLPAVKYIVAVKSGQKLRKFLESYGCRRDYSGGSGASTITVYCGGCYDYHLGTHGAATDYPHVSAKEFKRIVREALGESK